MQSYKETEPAWLRILAFPIGVLLFLLPIYLTRPPEHLTIPITDIGFRQQSAQTDEQVIILSNELLVPVTLCTGKDQHYDLDPFAPSLAPPGLTIQPTQGRQVIDLYPSQYSITIVTPSPTFVTPPWTSL